MLPKSNIHAHTTYCDGHQSPEEMIQAAIRLGFHTFGISEHGHGDYDPNSMTLEEEASYRAEMRALQAKYKDQINVLVGYEHDFLSPYNVDEYDYYIESVHYIKKDGVGLVVDNTKPETLLAIDRYFGGDPYAFCEEYFRTVAASVEKTTAPFIGHIELPMKFNEQRDMFSDTHPRYLKGAMEVLELAVQRDKIIEVNTGAISRGYRTEPYPGRAVLTRLHEMGGRIILTSDCHDAGWIDFGFEQAAAIARSCGFRTAWETRGSELVEYELG